MFETGVDTCVVGMHAAVTQAPAAIGRSLTIAELTGNRQLLAAQPKIAGGLRPASGRLHFSHSLDSLSSDRRSGMRQGRTVVQMLQDSLVQKAQSQDITAASVSSRASKVAVSQTGKLF